MAAIAEKEKPRDLDINSNGIIFLKDRALGDAATRVARQQFRWLRPSEIPLLYLWVEVNAIARSVDRRFKVVALFDFLDEYGKLLAEPRPRADIVTYFALPAMGRKRWGPVGSEDIARESWTIRHMLSASGYWSRIPNVEQGDKDFQLVTAVRDGEEASEVLRLTNDFIVMSPLATIWKD